MKPGRLNAYATSSTTLCAEFKQSLFTLYFWSVSFHFLVDFLDSGGSFLCKSRSGPRARLKALRIRKLKERSDSGALFWLANTVEMFEWAIDSVPCFVKIRFQFAIIIK